MSSFVKAKEKNPCEYLEPEKCSSNHVAYFDRAALFETFIPEQITYNENMLDERQQALYFQAQFPQTSAAASGSDNPLSIFIAHTYYDGRFSQKVEQILRTITFQERNINYQFGEIALDTRWEMSRHDYLESVDLVLLLVTQAFVATDYCYSEQLKWAILRHKEEKCYVIPILLQACLWDGTPFARLHTITPSNRKAVDEWSKPGLAFSAIAADIRDAVRRLRRGR